LLYLNRLIFQHGLETIFTMRFSKMLPAVLAVPAMADGIIAPKDLDLTSACKLPCFNTCSTLLFLSLRALLT
jgi:hypothetical protein